MSGGVAAAGGSGSPPAMGSVSRSDASVVMGRSLCSNPSPCMKRT